MLTSGDIIELDLGAPAGREAGYVHPAVLVTSQRILNAEPSVVQVVPLTSTIRPFTSEVVIEPDRTNGLSAASAAQCQHVRAISPTRILGTRGNVGSVSLTQIRETLAVILDIG